MSLGADALGVVSLGAEPPAAGGGAITIACSVGNAAAAGTAATINQAFAVTCTVGNATAAGTTATVNQAITLTCTVGNATAAGTAATVSQAISITSTVGNATAAGITAAIELGTTINIACAVGDAVAAGVAAIINQAINIGCAVGDAAAAGLSCTITLAPSGTIARPSSDTTPGGWLPSTGSDLYAMIDEVAYDDADYIYSTSTGDICELALSAVADPGTSSGQVVSYRAWSPTGNGLTVKLMQGVTTIATWTHATLPITATTYNQALSASECDAITDYSALSIKFEST